MIDNHSDIAKMDRTELALELGNRLRQLKSAIKYKEDLITDEAKQTAKNEIDWLLVRLEMIAEHIAKD